MRDRRADLCPSCGSKFKIKPRSYRRSRYGFWRDVECRGCGVRKMEFLHYPKVVSAVESG